MQLLDSRNLIFVYETQDIPEASRKINRPQGKKDRSVYINTKDK